MSGYAQGLQSWRQNMTAQIFLFSRYGVFYDGFNLFSENLVIKN